MVAKQQYDAVIAGAGLTGNTVAALLADSGMKCLVLDEYTPEQTAQRLDPRTLAITRASENILRTTGAWQVLEKHTISAFNKMHVWDEQGKCHLEFDSADLCQPNMGYIIEQKTLEQATVSVNQSRTSIAVMHGIIPTGYSYSPVGVRLFLSDNTELQTRLIIGADGSRSRIRHLAGINYPVHDYHQHALACWVKTGLSHGKVARQRFLKTGPLAFLPMSDEHQCGIVWSTTPTHAEKLKQMTQEAFMEELGRSFEFALGEITEVKYRTTFPLQHAQADHYCSPGIVLIGDAAHTVHPLAGQGANMGLLDAAALSQTIDYQQTSGVINRLSLRRYERWRKGENLLMLKTLQGIRGLFASQVKSVCHLRNLGMDILNNVTPVKNLLMSHAMGLSGDLPIIARRTF